VSGITTPGDKVPEVIKKASSSFPTPSPFPVFEEKKGVKVEEKKGVKVD
jgi:hypothetical protein